MVNPIIRVIGLFFKQFIEQCGIDNLQVFRAHRTGILELISVRTELELTESAGRLQRRETEGL